MEYIIETLQTWGAPIAGGLAVVFIIMQIIGEIIEWTGKVSPKILKIRKVIKEKRMQKLKRAKQLENLDDVVQLMSDVKATLSNLNQHYSEDNITQRNEWMNTVNTNLTWTHERARVYDQSVQNLVDLKYSVDKLTEFSCKNIKENYRNRILDFQHRIINAKGKAEPERFSHEEFNKIYATYDDYEEFLEYTDDTNHQVDNAMETIKKAERGECPNIQFVD